MKNLSNISNEVLIDETKKRQKPSITQKIKKAFLNRYTTLILGSAILASCSKEATDTPIEPVNKAPTITLTNVVSDDATNTVSGKFIATDSDGTIKEKTLQAEATDGTRQNITFNADGTFSHTLTGSGKVFDALLAKAKDNDNAPNQQYQNLTPTVEVEMPNTTPVINVVLNNFNENTPIGTVVGNVVGSDAENDTLTYTIIEGNDKFELDGTDIKTKIEFNHEDLDNTHTVKVQVSDGNLTATNQDTATENDLQEQQIIDIYGDGGLLPNGEKYATKADEEEAGETLPIDYYKSGEGENVVRQSEADIEADMRNIVYAPESDINGLHFDNTVPGYPNGEPVDPTVNQAMVDFDSANDEVNILSSTGAELAQIAEISYGKQLQHILDEISSDNNSNNFRKVDTDEYDVWRDKIVADTKNPTQPIINTHYAIKTKLTE